MKTNISKHVRYKAIKRVTEKYSGQFNGKPEVQAANESFAVNTNRIGDLLANLARPRKVLIGPKMDKQLKLRRLLFSMADLGISMASRQKNTLQVALFKDLRKASWKKSIWEMHQAAVQAYAELSANPEAAATVGITTEILEAFQQQIQDFGDILDDTDAQVKDRKAEREELRALFTQNTSLLKEQIEPAIRFEATNTPGLLREYLIARSSGVRKKHDSNAELLSDISGVVTDITTGEPVANATVDIAAKELLTTTDADGYYIFDELPAGGYILNCHATGYRVPEKVTLKAADGESLLVDFSLQPETGE